MIKEELITNSVISLRKLFGGFPFDKSEIAMYANSLLSYSESTIRGTFIEASKFEPTKLEPFPLPKTLISYANNFAKRQTEKIDITKRLEAPRPNFSKITIAALKSIMWLHYYHGWTFEDINGNTIGKVFRESFPEKKLTKESFEDLKKIYPREEILQWMKMQR